MNELVISRDDLVEAATKKLFHDSAVEQIMKDAAARFYQDNAMLSLQVAANMVDIDVKTLKEIAGDKIVRLGPRLSRISALDLKTLTAPV